MIVISGDIGSGKSELTGALVKALGYQVLSAGTIFRAKAEELGVTVREMHDLADEHNLDNEIDEQILSLEGDYIIDSRLAPYFRDDTFNVLLTVHPRVGATRVLLEKRATELSDLTVTQQMEENKKRRFVEVERFFKLYDIDLIDTTPFHFKLDTTNLRPIEVAERVREAYEDFRLGKELT